MKKTIAPKSKIFRRELYTYIIPLILCIGVFFLCRYFALNKKEDIFEFYSKNMRASLFAGFLTLGSFLLALKTGIVIKIKEGVYDKEEYQKNIIEQQKTKSEATVYGPLRRLSRLLSASVFFALLSSALQLTVGLFPNWISAAICISISAFSISILMVSFIIIQVNLSTWFDLMEDDFNKKNPKS